MTPDEDDPQTSELEGSEILSFNGKLTLTPSDNHRFELFATLIDEDRELRSSNSSGRYYATRYELDKYMAGVGWSGKIGPTESKLNLYRSRIDKLSTQRYDDDSSTSETPDIVTNDVLDGQCSLLLAAHRITLGGEYRLEKIEADSLEDAGGEEEVTHKALFLQDEFGFFGDRLQLTPGLRYDHHEYFGSELSPRVYAVFKLTDRLNLKAGYGHAFNAPTAKQVSSGYNASTGPHRILGNPEVEPETSDSYEIGVEYFGDAVTAKAFCFRNDVDDLIANNRIGSFGPGGRFGIYQADNVDKARIQGVETELEIVLPYALRLWVNYSYLDAEDTENDEPLPGRPEHSVNLKLAHTLQSLGLHTVLRYQYVGEQFFENDDDRMQRVPGYSLWHASVSKTLSDHFDLQLGVENIGDVRLRDDAELYSYEERGRFVYANLRAHF
ncbi:MAG: hypothetical protein AVO34_05985 [Firmicutes bacterium ML8_F2]|nr:MAG: hypothetical protein AVO34_05985 [Firmicutes bacterium ML8_F2]